VKVWIDGAIVEAERALIPVTDHGLLYGDGVFEGIRVYAGRVFRLADHLRRLETSARAIGLELPGGRDGIEKIVVETARAHGSPDGYLRLIVTRGDGELGVDPTTCHHPRVICLAAEVELYSQEKLSRGVDMVTASLRRPAPDALDPRIKSLNYLNSVLAKREARLRGADEALILNAAGNVAEASVANVFVVRRGVLSTPPATDGALDGITRDSVIHLAEGAGMPTRIATLGRVDLFAADEVFLTGTGARIVPVASLDGQPIGCGTHPAVDRLTKAFPGFARENGTRL
jgi:branched-chain amino acid aminotransferase